MQTKVMKVLGVEVTRQSPGTVKEFDTLAHRPGAALAGAIRQEEHKATNDIREQVVKLLEEGNFGKRHITLGKNPVTLHEDADGKKFAKDAKGARISDDDYSKIVVETAVQFFTRCVEENKLTPADFKDLIQKATDAVPFDPNRHERRPAAEKRAPKRMIALAKDVFKRGTQTEVAKNLADTLGVELVVTGDRETAINNLALAMAANERKATAERQAAYLEQPVAAAV